MSFYNDVSVSSVLHKRFLVRKTLKLTKTLSFFRSTSNLSISSPPDTAGTDGGPESCGAGEGRGGGWLHSGSVHHPAAADRRDGAPGTVAEHTAGAPAVADRHVLM